MRLRNLLTICVILLLAPCRAYSQQVTPGRAPDGPNVVLIIADDLAWDDTRAYGNTKVRTPTILELTGLPIPSTVPGRSLATILANPTMKVRDEIYAEKNWHDYEDRVRALRTERYKYIRNDYHDLPATPSADAGRSPSMEAIRALHQRGRLTPLQARIFQQPRPAEELYDLEADPTESRNLASDPAHQETLRQLRTRLNVWGEQTNDLVPLRRTPDEFDRQTGQPIPNRRLPRPGKAELTGLQP